MIVMIMIMIMIIIKIIIIILRMPQSDGLSYRILLTFLINAKTVRGPQNCYVFFLLRSVAEALAQIYFHKILIPL